MIRIAALVLTAALLPVAGARAEDPRAPSWPKCAQTTAGNPAAPPGTVTVASFNVLHGLEGLDPEDGADPATLDDYPAHQTLDRRLELAAAQIDAAGVDVVGMQEVSWIIPNDATLHVTQEVAAALADALAAQPSGDRWYWCWYLANPRFDAEPDLQPGGGGPLANLSAMLASNFVSPQYASFKEGLAVVSRYPIAASEGMRLPPRNPAELPLCLPADDPAGCFLAAGFERRAALWARIEAPGGTTIDITTTHLAHDITDLSDASGLQQVAAALAFSDARSAAAGHADARFFVCDCNATPDDDVPVVGTIESAGWTNTFTAACVPESDVSGCTAGPDRIVTTEPSRAGLMDERLDYVFAKDATCAPGNGRRIVDEPDAWDSPNDPDDATDGYLWPSDHIGVATDVPASC